MKIKEYGQKKKKLKEFKSIIAFFPVWDYLISPIFYNVTLRRNFLMCRMKWLMQYLLFFETLCGQNPRLYYKKPHVKARTKDIILYYLTKKNKRC